MIPIRDNVVHAKAPVVVYSLIAANTGVFLALLSMPESSVLDIVYQYGLVPRRYFDPLWTTQHSFFHESYWPFLTATFIHGGWLHIFFNMWTLYIFGSTLEIRLGPSLFLAFYICCAVASTFTHAYFNQDSMTPVIGASGAAAGLIGAYAVSFPRARITVLVPIVFIPLIFSVPAVAFAAVWFLFQLAQGAWDVLSTSVGDRIAWWAHVGGFIAGLMLLPLFLLFAPARSMQLRWQHDPWSNIGDT